MIQVSISAPQSLIDLLTVEGCIGPGSGAAHGSSAALSLVFPDIDVVEAMIDLDSHRVDAAAATIWGWYRTREHNSCGPTQLVTKLRNGTRRSTWLRSTSRCGIDRVLTALVECGIQSRIPLPAVDGK